VILGISIGEKSKIARGRAYHSAQIFRWRLGKCIHRFARINADSDLGDWSRLPGHLGAEEPTTRQTAWDHEVALPRSASGQQSELSGQTNIDKSLIRRVPCPGFAQKNDKLPSSTAQKAVVQEKSV
jgi:hypothetical protein